MRIVIGRPPPGKWDPDSEGWTRVREPGPWIGQILSLPFGLVALWMAWTSGCSRAVASFEALSPDQLPALMIPLIVAHELVHALVPPEGCARRATIFGVWPSRLLFYVHHDGIGSKGNLLLRLVAPFVALTILPIVCLAAFGVSNPRLALFTLVNAAGSSMDLLGFFVILLGVPSGASVRNHGWPTYWRLPPGGPLPEAGATQISDSASMTALGPVSTRR